MAILLLVVTVSLVAVLVVRGHDVRASIVKAYLAVFLLIAGSTEILTLAGAVSYRTVSLIWIVSTVVVLPCWWFVLARRDPDVSIKGWLRRLADSAPHHVIFLLLVATVLSLTLVVALAYPPNNWDSMTYHMSRVAQWIQRGSVEFYSTEIDRQNYQPPLAEFAILHVQLLSGSDQFANVIQWYSFFVTLVLVSLLARQCGLSGHAQLFSGAMAATLPMAILQSSSTQNDVVTSALCLAFAYFLLRFAETESVHDATLCALSLGLALLTKGTAYIYCCAIGLTIGAAALISAAPGKRLRLFGGLSLIVAAALALNSGHYSRNYLLYGHPLSTASGYTNDELSPAVIVASITRNAALHLATPVPRINWYGFRAMQRVLGDQLNNPTTTMGATQVAVPSFSLHEDFAGNALHLMLTMAAFLCLPFVTIARRRVVFPYAAAVLCAAALYCILLRWQPWASRLHTPGFMLSVPLVATVISGIPWWSKRQSACLAVLLFAYSVPFLFLNTTRPLTALAGAGASRRAAVPIERVKSYFVNRDLYAEYRAVARIIKDEGVEEVGLCFGYDDYEYPLWVLVGREASRGRPRLRHVGVTDVSRRKEVHDRPAPVLVMATKRLDADLVHGKGRIDAAPCLQQGYSMIFDAEHVRLWKLERG
jgi:dolichyl-phosphate-mannose-protein mannosyltransferase